MSCLSCWQIYPFSIAKLLVRKLLRFEDPGRPKFYFGEKGTPEEVQYRSTATVFFVRGNIAFVDRPYEYRGNNAGLANWYGSNDRHR